MINIKKIQDGENFIVGLAFISLLLEGLTTNKHQTW